MKLKTLSAVIATAVAGQAFALAPSVTPDATLYVGGATAVDKQFANYINQICVAGTLDVYKQDSDVAVSYFCEVDAAKVEGIATNINVLFNKNSGGSSKGVAPVANLTTVPFLDIKDPSCNNANPQFGGTYDCADVNVQAVPEVGISDVEPELFTIPSNGARSFDASVLNVNTVNAQTFGVVVSPGLRNALQAAQGLTVGSEDVKDMPSLSEDIIANIFERKVASWDELSGVNGPIATAAGQDNKEVSVCVRKPGSGTQAQFNAYFMKDACAYRGAGDKGFVGKITAADSDGVVGNHFGPQYNLALFNRIAPRCNVTLNDYPLTTAQQTCLSRFRLKPLAAPWVTAVKGSSDMGKCLTKNSEAGYWAIGLQSVEKVIEARTDRNNFRFLAINGVAPTLENVAAGLYRNWAAASIQWHDTNLTGADLALAKGFVAQAQDVAAVKEFDLSLKAMEAGKTYNAQIYDNGVPANLGSLAFANGVNVVDTSVSIIDNPVFDMNKGLVGPSSCAVPTVQPGSLIDVRSTGR